MRMLGPGGPIVESLDISPVAPDLSADDTQQMSVIATYSSGAQVTVTTSCAWSSSDEDVATVDEHGLVTAIGDGEAIVTASLGDQSIRTTVTVSGFSQAPVVDSLSVSHGHVGDFVTLTGSHLAAVTSVKFNGTDAPFEVVDDSTIIATVPNGATTGTVTATNSFGTGTGPSFTVDANVFAFNLDSSTMPSGLTGSRTGDPLGLSRDRGTSVEVSAALDTIYEDRDDGHGQMTMPAVTNEVPDPEDFSTWTTNGAVMTTGQPDPTGGSNATKIADANAAAVVSAYSPDNASDVYDPCASFWVKDDVGNPPSDSGAIGASDGGGGFPMIYSGILTSQDLGSGTTWRRRHGKIGTSGGHGAARCIVSPAGQTPRFNNYCSQNAPATGARHFWGAMAAGGPTSDRPGWDAPLVFGATSKRVISVDGGKLADVMDVNGDFDIEGRFFLPDIFASQTLAEMRVVTLSVGGVITRLSLDQSISWKWVFKDGPEGGDSFGYGRNGQLVEWRLFYKPSESISGIAVRFNGCVAKIATTVGASGAVGTPTGMWLGCDESEGKVLPAMHTLLRRSARAASTAYDSEGTILGDSTMAPYLGTVLVGSLFYTPDEAAQRRGIASLAGVGNTAVDQLARWQASSSRGDANTKWVLLQLGVNDIGGGASSSTLKTRIQAIIDDVNTNNPTAKVILVPMIPWGHSFDAGQTAIQQTVNAWLAGGGGGFTGSNLLFMPEWTALDDGSGGLLPQYQTGDGHNNDDARYDVEAPAYRAFLQANNLL